ncbi:peptide-methionine (S)-S-oxide reductase MsrA [Flavobacterium agricola]|uniref:Peptide methionine sulfoxide reductase MsrA n=1 Tax=Flavobacterium agricola TaxID=2870839 RepID=A0ABY6LYQ9_9FLAO|nr:peptide-methionine (S)-S-oxide reductase MsrA [Flavobacterium agricola]UYW00295.1 peptide-methionine (S)-S-oxide reductase MsrA [Flavobacterium agricola]
METKQITLGGGCFWCTEAIFKETEGVLSVTSGFSGGFIKKPAYREVCTGRTGHAEVVQITYNPEVIGLQDLVAIHLVTHNPTTLNAQGGDKGTQYRSIIFYNTEQEKEIIINQLINLEEIFDAPIVTEVKPFVAFYPAEIEHQNYYAENTEARYCQLVIAPKLEKYRNLKLQLKGSE